MKPLPLDQLAKEMQFVLNDYDHGYPELLSRRLKALLAMTIHYSMDKHMSFRGLTGVVEFPMTGAPPIMKSDGMYTTPQGDVKLQRIETARHTFYPGGSAAEVLNGSENMIRMLIANVQGYVERLPAETYCAMMPQLEISLHSFELRWFLWGYYGVMVCPASEPAPMCPQFDESKTSWMRPEEERHLVEFRAYETVGMRPFRAGEI